MNLERGTSDQGTGPVPEHPPGAQFELTKITAEEVLGDLESLSNAQEFTDISRMYQMLPSEELVVRRENPEQLLHTLKTSDPLSIQFVGNSPYANSVVWNAKADGPRGLDNAFLEGYSHMNGVVTVYGFRQPEGFHLEQHPESLQKFAGLDRLRVRTAAGFVPSDAIRFVTIRVPILGFPPERMTDEEKDLLWEYTEEQKKTPVFIYRGFLFTNEEAAHLKMAA